MSTGNLTNPMPLNPATPTPTDAGNNAVCMDLQSQLNAAINDEKLLLAARLELLDELTENQQQCQANQGLQQDIIERMQAAGCKIVSATSTGP